MPHPHQSYLDQFALAIKKFVPLVPTHIQEEAKKLHAELSADENASEKQIHQALVFIGRQEYPYRKAYVELCASDEEKRLQEAVYSRIDESLKTKLLEYTSHGVVLEEFVKSKLFEEVLEGDERYQIQQAIVLADEILEHQCDERAHKRKETFDQLVEKYKAEVARWQGMIDEMRRLGEEDKKWQAEIESVAMRLEEGWSITEKDPTEEEIMKELAYWKAVVNEEIEE